MSMRYLSGSVISSFTRASIDVIPLYFGAGCLPTGQLYLYNQTLERPGNKGGGNDKISKAG